MRDQVCLLKHSSLYLQKHFCYCSLSEFSAYFEGFFETRAQPETAVLRYCQTRSCLRKVWFLQNILLILWDKANHCAWWMIKSQLAVEWCPDYKCAFKLVLTGQFHLSSFHRSRPKPGSPCIYIYNISLPKF